MYLIEQTEKTLLQARFNMKRLILVVFSMTLMTGLDIQNAKAIGLSGAVISAGVSAAEHFSDNVYKTSGPKLSDRITVTSSDVTIGINPGKVSIGSNYNGSYSVYSNQPALNSENHSLVANMSYKANSWSLGAAGFYRALHDELGQPGTTTDFSNIPVVYQAVGGSLRFNLSDLSRSTTYNLGMSSTATRYTLPAQKFRDVDSHVANIAYSRPYSGKTNYGVYGDATYSEPVSAANITGVSLRSQLGAHISWLATGKMSGSARIGVGAFSNKNQSMLDNSSWVTTADISWKRNT